jgi:hypothetical protein
MFTMVTGDPFGAADPFAPDERGFDDAAGYERGGIAALLAAAKLEEKATAPAPAC